MIDKQLESNAEINKRGIEEGVTYKFKRDIDNNEDYHSYNDDNGENGAGGASAAGVVRGVSRSLGRSVARAGVGKLPRSARIPAPPSATVLLRKRLPVRRIAKVSDRLSTATSWWDSAFESEGLSETKVQGGRLQWINRMKIFAISLLKNTALGAIVFETYSHTVLQLAPPAAHTMLHEVLPTTTSISQSQSVYRKLADSTSSSHGASLDYTYLHACKGNNSDEFDRASIPLHFLAGSFAGAVHGLVSTLIESTTYGGSSTSKNIFRLTEVFQSSGKKLSSATLHHMLAHAMLFGVYESLKRQLLHGQLLWGGGSANANHGTNSKALVATEKHVDQGDISQHYNLEYLTSVVIAGGMAGQAQHVVSHYTEQWLGISSTTARVQPDMSEQKKKCINESWRARTKKTAVEKVHKTGGNLSFCNVLRRQKMRMEQSFRLLLLTGPALRPTMGAFLPSAVGFVAFEYGKKFM